MSTASIGAATLVLPEHRYPQDVLVRVLERRWHDHPHAVARLERLHRAVQVRTRCLALPLEQYDELNSFDQANDAFVRVGTELGTRAIKRALEAAELCPWDVDALFFTTVTGVAAPSLDARIMNRLELKPDVRRVPMFGLGCVGGAAGLARAADYLRGHPEHVAVLLSVELCSLTLQEDVSVANLIATGLFADGSAAVVLAGEKRGHAGPRIIDSRSAFFRNTERVMGWDVGSTGFRIVLNASVPEIVETELPRLAGRFLGDHGLTPERITRWICHPGGPKVIDAIERAFGLSASALAITRRSLAEVGNLSSGSVLHVLSETMKLARPGERGLLLAMGPGFCAELVLLEW
jgi:alkylresorcinol/alkylpyrone synthase